MARMKTFLLYALGIIGFIFLSSVLEDGLIQNMYVKMNGNVVSTQTSGGIYVEDVSGRATNMNGYMQFKLVNNSDNANNKFVKIELFSKQGLPAATKYVEITDLAPGSSKTYEVKFDGSEIRSYDISVIDKTEVPDYTNVISILGWEFDLENVFGFDLTDARIFGIRIADIFNVNNIKTAGSNAWGFTVSFLNTIPWWGYAIGAGIVFWYLPKGYLFGFFPL